MAGNKNLTKQRHRDVRNQFKDLSEKKTPGGKKLYTFQAIVEMVAKKTRFMPSTVHRIICTPEDQEKEDGSLKLF